MIYNIYHKTAFDYHGMVTFSHNIARLRPSDTMGQKVLEFSLEVEPQNDELYTFNDMFGNMIHHMLIREPHHSLSVIGHSKIERQLSVIDAHNAKMFQSKMTYKEARERLRKFAAEDVSAKQFLFASKLIPLGDEAIQAYVLESFHENRPIYEAGVELMQRIFNDFEFVSGFSDVTTPINTIFEARKGVCQDFAQFAISALRSIGLPAKYMSGYIETLPPKGEEKLFGVDASHAWVALYIPGSGWLELDPTNNLIPREQHIVLGYGRDYHDIAPLKGVVRSSGNSTLSVMVDVRREEEAPPLIQQQIQSQSQW